MKNPILIILLLSACLTSGYAQRKSKSDSIPPAEINKTDTTLQTNAVSVLHFSQKFSDSITKFIRKEVWDNPFSAPGSGFIEDTDKMYSKKQLKKLNKLIRKFEKETTMEIGIITIDSIFVSRENFDTLSIRIANKWGVGKKNFDNGILLSICNDYRKLRISLGRGTERILSNQETKAIINNEFIPYFIKGEYFEGTMNGLKKLMEVLRGKMEQEGMKK